MVLPLTSRFSVLSVDDEEDNSKKSAKTKRSDGRQPLNQQLKQRQDAKKRNKKGEIQQANMQNQSNKSKNKTTTSNQKKKKQSAADQWETWKEKDTQLLDGTYQNELHQAILLSQLDYEENKELYEQMKKEQELEKKSSTSIKRKKGTKAQTMTLSEFNNFVDSSEKLEGEGGSGDTNETVNGIPESDPAFFDRIKEDAKKAFSSEQAKEKRKAAEPLINNAITIAQFEVKLERRDKEIVELKNEITRLKEELVNVKTRNKTLCQILGQGEMKDKAEVLVQMEKLMKVKDELSNEVERLHAELEQERSKVRALMGDKTKGKNKKRTDSK